MHGSFQFNVLSNPTNASKVKDSNMSMLIIRPLILFQKKRGGLTLVWDTPREMSWIKKYGR